VETLSGTTLAIIDGTAIALLLGGLVFVVRWLNGRLERAEAKIEEMHREMRLLAGLPAPEQRP
jgi:hypothetical protein